MKRFVKYLVDRKQVFDFVEQIVDESDDVSCEFVFVVCFLYFCLFSYI